MITNKLLLWLSFSLLLLASDEVASQSPASSPPLAEWKYTEPDWWDLISETFEGTLPLKQCNQRQFPPSTGAKCGRREKTCFFGDQTCPSSVPYPAVRCDCSNKKWNCRYARCISCPVFIKNIGCPASRLNSDGSNAVCENVVGSCTYGGESCCGNCLESIICRCNAVGEEITCFDTCNEEGECLMPEAGWASLVGLDCDPDAKNAVLAGSPPGTEVLCIEEGTIVTRDVRLDRVRIYTKKRSNIVSQPPEVG